LFWNKLIFKETQQQFPLFIISDPSKY